MKRWWIYQRERFPLLKHGILIAVFSSAGVFYAALLRRSPQVTISALAIAFIVIFCCFLQLRIADEFKDYDDDLQHRPYRAVPRGLVRLHELGFIGVGSALLQVGCTFWLATHLLMLLLLIWGYFACMCCEFFVRSWLKSHPLVYMVSHMGIMPLMSLFATACDWLPADDAIPNVTWFLAASLGNGFAIEIGRKIRSPQMEEAGVETYSAVWGLRNALLGFLAAIAMGAIASVCASIQIGFLLPVLCISLVAIAGTGIVIRLFLRDPQPKWSKAIEAIAGIWTMLVYLHLGVIPYIWRLGSFPISN